MCVLFLFRLGFLRSKRQVYALSCSSVLSTSCARHATPLWVPRSRADARAALHGMPPWFWQALLRWEHGSQPPAEHRGPLKIKLEDSELGDRKLSLLPFFYCSSLSHWTKSPQFPFWFWGCSSFENKSLAAFKVQANFLIPNIFFWILPQIWPIDKIGGNSHWTILSMRHFLVKDIGVPRWFSACVRPPGVGRSEEWWLTSLTVASLGGCSGLWGGGTGCWGNGLSRAHGSQIVEVSLLLGRLRRVFEIVAFVSQKCRKRFSIRTVVKIGGCFFLHFFAGWVCNQKVWKASHGGMIWTGSHHEVTLQIYQR